MDPSGFYDTCMYTYCQDPGQDRAASVCPTFTSYARECSQQRITITWRRAGFCGEYEGEPGHLRYCRKTSYGRFFSREAMPDG